MKKALKTLALALAVGGVLATAVSAANNMLYYESHPTEESRALMKMDGLEQVLEESFGETFVAERLNANGEADSAKWITIDGNGDGHKWYHSSESNSKHAVSTIGSCHDIGYMMSESYCNATWNAMSPDDYLVTPEIQLGKGVSYMTFNAGAQDSSYPNENYTVAVYVVGEGDALDKNAYADLTDNEGIVLPDRSARNPGEQVFDLSAYAGKKVRLAVHHHNTRDQFILCVDCVTVWTAPVKDGKDVVPKSVTGFSYFRTAPIFFNTNGGSKINTLTRVSGAFVDLAGYVPVKEGYVFTGWYTDEALTKPVKSFYVSTMLKLYAGWEEIVEEPALTEEAEETTKVIPEI